MKTRVLVPAVLALMISTGCIGISLHPLYTEKDVVFEPELIGEWGEPDNADQNWVFSKREDYYSLAIRDGDGKITRFETRMVKLGEHRFLDILPDAQAIAAIEGLNGYEGFLLPVHLILRVDQVGRTLELSMLDLDWLEQLLREKPEALRHEIVGGDRLVLTAPTEKLQQFVIEHAKNPQAFRRMESMERKKARLADGGPQNGGQGDRP